MIQGGSKGISWYVEGKGDNQYLLCFLQVNGWNELGREIEILVKHINHNNVVQNAQDFPLMSIPKNMYYYL